MMNEYDGKRSAQHLTRNAEIDSIYDKEIQMKACNTIRSTVTLNSVALILVFSLGGSVSFAAKNTAAVSIGDVVTEMKGKLNLNDQQVKDVTAALTDLSNTLNTLVNKQEGAPEDNDPHDFINGVKDAQAEYQKNLKSILNDSQMQSYDALKEQVIMDALDNLAAIKLMDIQDQIGFSDDQLNKLTPVLGQSMRGLIQIAWKYAGERLRLGEKIRIARELKEIQHKSEREVKEILTPDQYKKWETYKKQQQGK